MCEKELSRFRYAKKDIDEGALRLTERWLRKADTGHKSLSREVMMMVAPSCLVVFVQGIRKDAEEEPLGRSRKVTVAVRVA